jgi:hypothetical protein
MGIIHMNGRLYDPLIARFMSADPFIQAPGNLQSYNRYAYVMNNPLNLTDPSGYLSLRSVVKIVVIAVISYYTAGAVSGWMTAAGTSSGSAFAVVSGGTALSSTGISLSTLGGIVSGAAGGFVGGALSTGTLRGGVQGAFTGGVFGGIGATGAGNGWGTGEYVAAHAAGGCITSVTGGGNCGSGAASGAFGKFTTLQTESWGAGVGQFTASVVAGGVGSVIAGGKFENGATTAAFAYLFNHCQTYDCALAQAWRETQQTVVDVFNKVIDGVASVYTEAAITALPGGGIVKLPRLVEIAGGFKVTEKYLNYLAANGRELPIGMLANEVMAAGQFEAVAVNIAQRQGEKFLYYKAAFETTGSIKGFDLVVNPATKEIWHFSPIKTDVATKVWK